MVLRKARLQSDGAYGSSAHQHELRQGLEQRGIEVVRRRRSIVLVDQGGHGLEKCGSALEVFEGDFQAVVRGAVRQRANLALQGGQIEQHIDPLKVDIAQLCKEKSEK